MIYYEHGSFSIDRFEDILMISLFEETNIEMFQKLEKDMELKRLEIGNREWALVVNLNKWKLGPPEFLQAMLKHNNSTELKGVRSHFVIIVTQSSLIKEIVKKAENLHLKQKIYLADSIEDASQILKDSGFTSYEQLTIARKA